MAQTERGLPSLQVQRRGHRVRGGRSAVGRRGPVSGPCHVGAGLGLGVWPGLGPGKSVPFTRGSGRPSISKTILLYVQCAELSFFFREFSARRACVRACAIQAHHKKNPGAGPRSPKCTARARALRCSAAHCGALYCDGALWRSYIVAVGASRTNEALTPPQRRASSSRSAGQYPTPSASPTATTHAP